MRYFDGYFSIQHILSKHHVKLGGQKRERQRYDTTYYLNLATNKNAHYIIPYHKISLIISFETKL